MAGIIDAAALKAEIHACVGGSGEVALLDIREHGQYGAGHPFFAVSCPYSVLEKRASVLVPRCSAPVVVFDDDDGVAERAAAALEGIGYSSVRVLSGGAPGWAAAGYTLYQGVNLPSKTFGELVEHACHTPSITAEDLHGMQTRGDNIILLDGRTPAEYANFNIPGGISCPNAELPLRFDDLVSDADTTVVINCAGRTRSIIGAQTLIDFGIAQKVVALENGTQGWALIDLELERGADRFAPENVSATALEAAHGRAMNLAAKDDISFVDGDTLAAWRGDDTRTTYLIDVRSGPEFETGHLAGARHAPGGQLVQATDLSVGVMGARIVVCDDTEVRAVMAAHWLGLMGRDVHVLRGGVGAAAMETGEVVDGVSDKTAPHLTETSVDEMRAGMVNGTMVAIDIRSSQSYRDGHVSGAHWALRPQMPTIAGQLEGMHAVLIAEAGDGARLAALDASALGAMGVTILAGGMSAWLAAGHTVERSPDVPADGNRKDYLFFTGQRHMGNKEHMRQYLEWEIGLVGQLDADERAAFKLPEL
ncbi:MAG: sulfurtransferase [Rhodospirillaceae bacterium]|nr:sulfurtransferase [Rhodospirillaceae bacterium]